MVAQIQRPTFSSSRSYDMEIEGLVQVFTCPHRNFFTSVMSQAIRLAGQGTSVLVVQFLKGGIGQGYDRPMQLAQNLDWVRCDLPRCIDTPEVDEFERRSIIDLWQYMQNVVYQNRYDLVVLDELSVAMNFNLISQAEVLEFLRKRPRHIDVILTGPDVPDGILDVADQITELRRSHQP
ncbi:P-loop NTPase family protein [filamentous cyanobacterium LEGE 11480]|uniref:P-loop NTPase family protein n=1 Tax=Romeriopsis navalis LEGE 11480 TaxID=2777977 RepID=A0A928Z2P0_9CYAN|nr:P-loop NTPase family protein [Romeriopsis navalis]MBE9030586.1 P-loop NTPase family protein [Romeriopsis navalis LEGE 11480]